MDHNDIWIASLSSQKNSHKISNYPHVQNEKNSNVNVYANTLEHVWKFPCLWTLFATTLSRVRGHDSNTYIWVVKGYMDLSANTIKTRVQKLKRPNFLSVILGPIVINDEEASYVTYLWLTLVNFNNLRHFKTQLQKLHEINLAFFVSIGGRIEIQISRIQVV